MREDVPRIEATGAEVETIDIDERPTDARRAGVDKLPTITVTDKGTTLIRSVGRPSEKAMQAILEACTSGS